MPARLRWSHRHLTSALHAAQATLQGHQLLAPPWAEAVAEPARQLQHELLASGWPTAVLWRHLFAFSATAKDSTQLTNTALQSEGWPCRTSQGDEHNSEWQPKQLARCIDQLGESVRQLLPDLPQQLALRSRPLREQWEARGPGLMHNVSRWVHPQMPISPAHVLLVHPVLGGGGAVHWPHASVRIEAVLANPLPQLPEVVRLAWLLAQLSASSPQAAPPHASTPAGTERQRRTVSLALVPPVLAAAEDVELARCDRPTLSLALTAWGLATADSPDHAATTDRLFAWWQTAGQRPASWQAAVAEWFRDCSEPETGHTPRSG